MNKSDSESNETKKLFNKACKIFYLLGSPNFWFEDFKYSKLASNIHDKYITTTNVTFLLMIVSQVGANFTQKNLTEKQKFNVIFFTMCFPILYINVIYLSYKVVLVRKVLLDLTVAFKRVCNDLNLENLMVRKTTITLRLFVIFTCMFNIIYSLEALTVDATFPPLITAWPDVTDTSLPAKIWRIFIYISWWLFHARYSVIHCLVIALTICLNHQFKQLCSYFDSLNDIFEQNLTQEEKEKKYEDGVKIGIKLHADTLECTRNIQRICTTVYGGQVLNNISILVLLMFQIVNSARNIANTLTTLISILALMFNTGWIMWNAGDVTEEASHLPTAIYGSGWQHCHQGSSKRVRSLLVIAMIVGQEPVVLKTFFTFTLSYATFVMIVKSSYSVFSVFY